MEDDLHLTALLEKILDEKKNNTTTAPSFPLTEKTYGIEEVKAMLDVILSGRLTIASGDECTRFEQAFAKWIGSPYAVMVNSGSSANLLAVAVSLSSRRENHIVRGDQVLVPAVCWSTSVWPIVQLGLEPVFVDVDPQTLNISIDSLRQKISKRTKVILLVHVLGNCGDMDAIRSLAVDNNLIVIEDTCEALGSTFHEKKLGTFGDFGTYSFYYSHHITTGEGGMVVCNTLKDKDMLISMRAHGWSRGLSNEKILENTYPEIDSRFLFVDSGFNVRPMEIQAAMGLVQLKKANQFNNARHTNFDCLLSHLERHPKWKQQFEVTTATEGAKVAWFGLSAIIASKHADQTREYLSYLSSKGVQNRPIISGNFIRQPAIRRMLPHIDPNEFTGAEIVGNRGFFIGIHVEKWSDDQINELCDILLGFDFR